MQQICSEIKVKLSNAYYYLFFLLGHSNSTQYCENIGEVAMRIYVYKIFLHTSECHISCSAKQLMGYFWIFHFTEFFVKLFWGHTKLNPNSKYLWIHYALHPLFGCPWQKLNARSYPKLTLYIFLITITGLVTDIRQTIFRIVMKLFLVIYWKAMKISHDCLQLKVQQTPRHPDYICLKVQIPTIKILVFICQKLRFPLYNFEENIVLNIKSF